MVPVTLQILQYVQSENKSEVKRWNRESVGGGLLVGHSAPPSGEESLSKLTLTPNVSSWEGRSVQTASPLTGNAALLALSHHCVVGIQGCGIKVDMKRVAVSVSTLVSRDTLNTASGSSRNA